MNNVDRAVARDIAHLRRCEAVSKADAAVCPLLDDLSLEVITGRKIKCDNRCVARTAEVKIGVDACASLQTKRDDVAAPVPVHISRSGPPIPGDRVCVFAIWHRLHQEVVEFWGANDRHRRKWTKAGAKVPPNGWTHVGTEGLRRIQHIFQTVSVEIGEDQVWIEFLAIAREKFRRIRLRTFQSRTVEVKPLVEEPN